MAKGTATKAKPIPASQVKVRKGATHPSQQDSQRPYDKNDSPNMKEFLELQTRVTELEALVNRLTSRFRDK